MKETPFKWNKVLISYLKRLKCLNQLEYARKKYTKLDSVSFYDYVVKKRQKIKEQERLKEQLGQISNLISVSVIFSGIGNPILGVAINACVQILAKEEIKQSTFTYLKRTWERLPLISRQIILLGAGMGAATSVILITSIIFNVDTARGGISKDAFVGRRRAFGDGKLFGNGFEILTPLAPNFCEVINDYASKYPWNESFTPLTPENTNYQLMNLAIRYISYKVATNNVKEMYVSPTILFSLYNLCNKQLFS